MALKADNTSEASAQPEKAGLSQSLMLLAAGGLFQTLGETLALGTPGPMPPGKAVIIFGSVISGVSLLWLALWRARGWQTSSRQSRQITQPSRLLKTARLAKTILPVLLCLAALWTLVTTSALVAHHPLDPGIYDSDAAAFIHYQAEDVLHEINPYTDQAGFWKAVQQFPAASATPLQRGQFGKQTFAPDDNTTFRLLRIYAQNPKDAGPEFDPASLHSYPAGAFLFALPFIWAGLSSTQPLYALCLLLLIALLLRWSPKGQHWQTLLIFAGLSIVILLTLRSSFEIICVLCILGAWRHQEQHPWLSAALLGLGCSVKQLTWLFVPFYLLWVARRYGWRRASISGALCSLVFLGINAPFLFNSPGAWASSMLLPISEPAFPGGIGLITLAQGGWLPLFPGWIYTALEITSYISVLAWYAARQFSRASTDRVTLITGIWGLLLAPLPLLLASRSLISYTMFLPVLALAALFQQYRWQPETAAEQESAALSTSTSVTIQEVAGS